MFERDVDQLKRQMGFRWLLLFAGVAISVAVGMAIGGWLGLTAGVSLAVIASVATDAIHIGQMVHNGVDRLAERGKVKSKAPVQYVDKTRDVDSTHFRQQEAERRMQQSASSQDIALH